MKSDAELLRTYVNTHCEPAFSELVTRHLDFVYSVVLPLVGRDAHLAHDASQLVFVDVARKASALCDRPDLSGWLYKAAHFSAAKIVRAECRRQKFEQEAYVMQIPHSPEENNAELQQVESRLDAALLELKEQDREAILLRFFRRASFVEMGTKLQMSEDGARKRVERAVDKLRHRLIHRGATATVALLGAVLANKHLTAAPTGSGFSVAGQAVKQTATANGLATWLASLSRMGISKFAAGIAAMVVVTGTGTIFYVSQMTASLAQTPGMPMESARSNAAVADLKRGLAPNV